MGPNHFSNHINVIRRCFDKFVFNFTRLDQNLIFLPTGFTLWWNKSKQLQPKTIHHLNVKPFFQTSNQIWHSGGATWLKCCEKRPFWSLTHFAEWEMVTWDNFARLMRALGCKWSHFGGFMGGGKNWPNYDASKREVASNLKRDQCVTLKVGHFS